MLPAALVFATALVIAQIWPPTYRSTATILVEQAEVPEDLAGTLVDDQLNRRLESITRRILVTSNLLRIIEQYDLYQEERRRLPVITVVENMRGDIGRQVFNVEGERGARATIAFAVTFDHREPEIAQRVTNELVSLYLNENLRMRRERATETAAFFRSERERAEQRIAELGRQLADFKRENNGSLPDQLMYNQQIIARTEQELRDVERQIQSLKEQEIFLQAQLALIEPYTDDGASASPAARLNGMRAQLAAMSARYGPEHPDVVKLKREVSGLETMLGVDSNTDDLEAARAELRSEIESLRSRYAADHPDVRRAERELQRVETALRASNGGNAGASPPDSPAYIQLQAQFNAVRSQLVALHEQRRLAAERLATFEDRILRTPLVEREFASLEQALADVKAFRDELARKEAVAQLGQSLETEQKAERFSLIEPPTLPAAPLKPDRRAIAAVGFVLAVAAGLGVVFLAHALDDSIYSPREIAQIVGEAPLAVIPRIHTAADQTRMLALRVATIAVLVVGTGSAVWWANARYGPLDIAWYDFQRRVLIKIEPFVPDSVRTLLGAAQAEER